MSDEDEAPPNKKIAIEDPAHGPVQDDDDTEILIVEVMSHIIKMNSETGSTIVDIYRSILEDRPQIDGNKITESVELAQDLGLIVIENLLDKVERYTINEDISTTNYSRHINLVPRPNDPFPLDDSPHLPNEDDERKGQEVDNKCPSPSTDKDIEDKGVVVNENVTMKKKDEEEEEEEEDELSLVDTMRFIIDVNNAEGSTPKELLDHAKKQNGNININDIVDNIDLGVTLNVIKTDDCNHDGSNRYYINEEISTVQYSLFIELQNQKGPFPLPPPPFFNEEDEKETQVQEEDGDQEELNLYLNPTEDVGVVNEDIKSAEEELTEMKTPSPPEGEGPPSST